MVLRLLIINFFLLCLSSSIAQTLENTYKNKWLEIDSLVIKKDLTKSALEKVNTLYFLAKKHQLPGQVIKCLVYQYTLEEKIISEDANWAIKKIKTEIVSSKDEMQKAILYSMLANQYREYLAIHIWDIYSRKSTYSLIKGELNAWSSDDFRDTISAYYLMSLKNEKLLQQTSISAYEAVIIPGNSKKLRPTLFDLLAHEALDFFCTIEPNIRETFKPTIINQNEALSISEVFINAKNIAKNSSSAICQAVTLFQKLISFHRNDLISDAFVCIDIERLEWLYAHSTIADKETIYRKTLENIIQIKGGSPYSSRAWYLLALLEYDKGADYQPFTNSTHQYSYLAAEILLIKGCSLYTVPNAGVTEMQNLLSKIKQKVLNIQIEKVNVPDKPFRALVRFRNTDTVFVKIIRLVNNDTIQNYSREKNFWLQLNKLTPYRSFSQVLPKNSDHQPHKTEIKVEGLPVGEYAIIGSNGVGFADSLHNLSVNFIHVSNISYIKSNNDFFVVNRENGKPIANVKVIILKQQYNSRVRKARFDTIDYKSTNAFGNFNFTPKGAGGNFRYFFSTQSDKLFLKEPEYSYYNKWENTENLPEAEINLFKKQNKRIFFFTDRAIYRPGQSLYFKGIAITKDAKSNLSKILTDKDSDYVYLKDANNKLLDSMQIKVNAFGSFTGIFRIPQNVFMGNLTIVTPKYNYSSKQISVEEYKRHKFMIFISPLKGSYRLNDSITMSGSAIAFTGNKMGDAKVKYQIYRTAKNQELGYSNRPLLQQGRIEIANGELFSDTEGKFNISFKAEAEDITNRNENPIFNYNVQVDVTDRNGETHSSDANISAGFRTLQLQMVVPDVLETDSINQIKIITTNFNNEKESAPVQIKIFQLQSPERLIRNRYWQQPDQFVLSEKEFLKYFPTDEYINEHNKLSWPISKLVSEFNLPTGANDNYNIAPGTLPPGYYKIEGVATDKYGEEVKQVNYFQVFNSALQLLPFLTTQFNYATKNKLEPEESATLYSGSTANNIYVIRHIEKATSKEYGFEFEYRKSGISSFHYKASEQDRGGITIGEAYVFDNRIYTHVNAIQVPWTNKILKVNYSSFRNKTEPGSEEKWTVTIEGNKRDKVVSELLTTLYDASLDNLKNNSWQIPAIWERPSFNGFFTGNSNFTNNLPRENYFQKQNNLTYITKFDRLIKNGFEFWNKSSLDRFKEHSLVYSYTSAEPLQEMVNTGKGIRANKESSGSLPIMGTNSIIQEEDYYKVYTSVDFTDPLSGKRFINGRETKDNKEHPNNLFIQTRKNFNETAFFLPQLYADTGGNYSFSFKMPEAITAWKWLTLAHTKELAFGTNSTTIITQKKLMVQPNVPRFLREGDNLELSTQIVNLSEKEMTGQITLELLDGITLASVDGWFQNVFPSQYFTIESGKTVVVKFPVQIPFSFNKPLIWRMIAKSEDYTDGEENTLPVLTNRMLVTESFPLFLTKDTVQNFTFNKLLNNISESLTHESFTTEYTSNPIWFVVGALPYLMENRNETVEQSFHHFYANSLASYIINKHPNIKNAISKWKSDSTSLRSNFYNNQELKQVLLEETPWVLAAETETEQKSNIVLLFNQLNLTQQSNRFIEKLKAAQLPNGSFSWFKGGTEDRNMTNYILTGIGKLRQLGAISPETMTQIKTLLVKALKYMDEINFEDYNKVIKIKSAKNVQNISMRNIDYLYMRSFFSEFAQPFPMAFAYFYNQGKRSWTKQNSYYKAQLGLIFYRYKEENFVNTNILPALLENSVTDEKLGIYWKSTNSMHWSQSPIEHQSMMIAFISEINQNNGNPSVTKKIGAMKTWLLLNKQTNNWKTTIATADACYALLLNGTDWLQAEKKIDIQLGNQSINKRVGQTTADLAYFKKRIEGNQVNQEMGKISVQVTTKQPIDGYANPPITQSPSWGSVYWQYFEELDKINQSASPLSINKKIFIERNSAKGKILDIIKDGDELTIGDKLIVKLEINTDRDMEYLHVKDMHSATMEPTNVMSGYKWGNRISYYESTKDVSSNFFINYLPKGSYVFDYPVFITHTGIFSVGIASIQNMYAPEFTSHSEGIKIRVVNPNP